MFKFVKILAAAAFFRVPGALLFNLLLNDFLSCLD